MEAKSTALTAALFISACTGEAPSSQSLALENCINTETSALISNGQSPKNAKYAAQKGCELLESWYNSDKDKFHQAFIDKYATASTQNNELTTEAKTPSTDKSNESPIAGSWNLKGYTKKGIPNTAEDLDQGLDSGTVWHFGSDKVEITHSDGEVMKKRYSFAPSKLTIVEPGMEEFPIEMEITRLDQNTFIYKDPFTGSYNFFERSALQTSVQLATD